MSDQLYPGPRPSVYGEAAAGVVVRGPAVRRISWAAIFAGVVIVMAVQVLLTLLGVGVGLNLIAPGNGPPQPSSLGMGAGIWWVVSNLIALVLGGYVAARLAGVTAPGDGALHGLVTWAFTLLLTFFLLTTTLGTLVGGAFRALGDTVAAAGSGLKQMAPQIAEATGVSPDQLLGQARELLNANNQDPARMSRDEAAREIADAAKQLAAGGDQAAQARDRIIAIVSAQLGISRDAAAQRVDQWRQRLDQAKANAARTATTAVDRTAKSVSWGSILAFVAFVLGAIAAALGGVWGVRPAGDGAAIVAR
jgi:hypothetical protein